MTLTKKIKATIFSTTFVVGTSFLLFNTSSLNAQSESGGGGTNPGGGVTPESICTSTTNAGVCVYDPSVTCDWPNTSIGYVSCPNRRKNI